MNIIAETLVVVQRVNPDTARTELLVGVQKRGPWKNFFNFPGGKAEGHELLENAAVREVLEETGVELDPTQIERYGRLIIRDLRPGKERFGTVAIFGATVDSHTSIRSNPEEFDCLWVDPTNRNILLSFPHDVRYWLPAIYRQPREPFTCLREIDEGGGDYFTTVLDLPGQQHPIFDEPKFNL